LLSLPSRIVGVDYGQKRVGLALADPLRIFAQPWTTVPPREALQALRRLQQKEGLDVVVVGWPLTPDGDEGEATERVERFIGALRRTLGQVTVVKWDERYTSEEAKALIRQGARPRTPRQARGRIDAAAAALILQEYLDQALNP
jgi:putative Holliday junction resolvase